MWNEYGEEVADYTPLVSEPPFATPEAGGGGIIGGISDSLKSFTSRFTSQPTSTQDTVGSQLYSAIYAFGAGKIDLAREQAAKALLSSKSGQKYVSEVERQRLLQLAPMFLIGVIVFGIIFFFLWRK